MPQGRKKIEDPAHALSKATRLTFRLSDDTVAAFKTIAAIKRLKLEELGKEAIEDLIKKYKPTLKNIESMFE
jgi:predicted transcriptional regulator